MYNTTPLPEQKPIAFKSIRENGSSRMIHKNAWNVNSLLPLAVEDEPGLGGLYPCYSLVEDTECI